MWWPFQEHFKDEPAPKFKPDATSLQPSMGIAKVSDGTSPADYVSSDPDPVLPNSKPMCQRPSFERGGGNTNVAAWSWNLASYQQDDVAGQYEGPPLKTAGQMFMGMREGMSTMAGTRTTTNEIYGPRIPKSSGPDAPNLVPTSTEDSSRRLPLIYGPSVTSPNKTPTGGASGPAAAPGATPGVPGAAGAPGATPGAPGATPGATGATPGAPGATPGATGTATGGVVGPLSGTSNPYNQPQIGGVSTVPGELDVSRSDPAGPMPPPPGGFAIPAMPKIDPVPFLADFSKFFR